MSNQLKFHASVTVTNKLEVELHKIIANYRKDKVFLVTENRVKRLCEHLIEKTPGYPEIKKVVIPDGEENKKLSSVEKIWMFLSNNGADRKSLVINLGGGMLTDLGSFAASTFKRGCDFVNIPTTLLAQVDASVGGKTGFNFNGLKNEIGVINQPRTVIIDTRFLETLDRENFISGYAEMIKHGLINSTEHLEEVKAYDLESPDLNVLTGIIARSVAIKDYFVYHDPYELNIRKALNFGHTAGHAFESFAMQKNSPLLHGYAVAYGMIPELYLSHIVCGFPIEEVNRLSEWLLSVYGKFEISDKDFATLYSFMTHDKKNEGERINFSLLPEPGKIEINQNCSRELIEESLNYYCSL
jgi:3-dehydroquinate synthase